jgi:CRP/FNR family cyclic AMP-dependent transcriptional regulator
MSFIKRDQKIERLKNVPMFSKLNKRQLTELAKHSQSVSLKAGAVLAEQGTQGWEFFFIMEGKAKVLKNGKAIRQMTSGGFFGEISLIDREPRTASVIAETDVTLLVVDTRSFDHLLETIPGLQKRVMFALCGYIRRAEKLAVM